MDLTKEAVANILMARWKTIRGIGDDRLLPNGYLEAGLDDFIQDVYLRVLKKKSVLCKPESWYMRSPTLWRGI